MQKCASYCGYVSIIDIISGQTVIVLGPLHKMEFGNITAKPGNLRKLG